jgi:hypothetical protein
MSVVTEMRVTRTERRPFLVWLTIGILGFLGVTATAGGWFVTFGWGGEAVALPADWLDAIPLIDSWVIPGLVLGIGFGLGSLLVMYGMLALPDWGFMSRVESSIGHHWSWLGTILIGIGHVVWIGLEIAFLPELSVLQAVYGVVGLALLTLPFTPAVRGYLARG